MASSTDCFFIIRKSSSDSFWRIKTKSYWANYKKQRRAWNHVRKHQASCRKLLKKRYSMIRNSGKILLWLHRNALIFKPHCVYFHSSTWIIFHTDIATMTGPKEFFSNDKFEILGNILEIIYELLRSTFGKYQNFNI